MAAKTGSLYVDLSLNFAKFTSGLDQSRTKATTFGVAVGGILKDVSEKVLQLGKDAALALPRLVEHSIDVADAMGKAAQKVGVTTETLSVLAHAAELSDVSFEELTTGLGRLGVKMSEAAGKGGATRDAFAAVGISAKELQSGSVTADQALQRISNSFAKLKDSPQKAAESVALFSRAGFNLIPLMNSLGGEGFGKLAEQAEKAGKVISEQTTKAAEQFNDNVKILQGSISGLGISIANQILPALVGFTEALKDAVPATKQLGGVIGLALLPLKGLAELFTLSLGGAQKLGVGVKTLGAILIESMRFDPAGMKALFAEFDREIKEIDAQIAVRLGQISGVTPLEGSQKLKVTVLPDIAGIREADFQKLKDSIKNRHIDPIHIPIDLSDFQKDLTQTGFFQALSLIERSTAEQRIISLTKSIEEFQQNLLLAGKPFLDLNEVAKMNEVTAKSLGHEWEDALLKAQGAGERANSVMQDLTHTLAQGFEDAIIGGQGLRGILQGIIQDVERLILRMAITGPSGVLAGIIGSIGNTIAGAFGGGAAGSGGRVLAGGGTILGGAEVPHFATGGIVTKPTFAMIGERGPEAIVPLSKMRGAGGSTVNVTYQIDARGADAGAEQRIRQGLRATHARAVSDALKIGNELKLRTA